jgi:hypothetical protein
VVVTLNIYKNRHNRGRRRWCQMVNGSKEKHRLGCLGVQKWWHLLAQIFDNGIWASFDLETGRNGMQLDIGLDFSGDLMDLAGFLVGPHGGAEL